MESGKVFRPFMPAMPVVRGEVTTWIERRPDADTAAVPQRGAGGGAGGDGVGMWWPGGGDGWGGRAGQPRGLRARRREVLHRGGDAGDAIFRRRKQLRTGRSSGNAERQTGRSWRVSRWGFQ